MSRSIVQDGRLIDETLEAPLRQVVERCELRDQGIERRLAVARSVSISSPLGSINGCFGAPKQRGYRRYASTP